jgi:hypothetical protein
MPFAVADQGAATAFTALRLAGEYARDAGVELVVVVLLDSTLLPYTSELAPDAVPQHDCGVGLLLRRDPRAALVVRQTTVPTDGASEGATDGEVADRLAELLGEAGAHAADVVGHRLAALCPGTVAAGTGRPAGAVLWAAVDAAGDGRLVVADWDRELGYLCVAAVDR